MISSSRLSVCLTGASLVLVITFIFAAPATAQTDLQEQLQRIKQQVNALQQDILNSSSSNTKTDSEPTTTTSISVANLDSIPNFQTNLSYGDRGTEVRYLQQLLNQILSKPVAETGPGALGQETTFFGPKTVAAVNRFQSQYADEVLAPVGLQNSTGYVGLQTRAKLNDILKDVSEFSTSNQANQQPSDLNEASDDLAGDSDLEQLRSQFTLDKWSFTEEEKRRIVQTVPVELRSEYFPEYYDDQNSGEVDNSDTETGNSLQQEYQRRLEQQSSVMERLRDWIAIESLKQPTQLLQRSLATIFGYPDTAQAQGFLVFGGRISAVIPCTCNPPAVQVTVVGPRPASVVYFPLISQKAPPTPPAPGAATLGNYTAFGTCLTGAPPACVPTPAFGSIMQMGTSY